MLFGSVFPVNDEVLNAALQNITYPRKDVGVDFTQGSAVPLVDNFKVWTYGVGKSISGHSRLVKQLFKPYLDVSVIF